MKTYYKKSRFCVIAASFAVFASVFIVMPAFAEVKGPGWFLGDAKSVSLEESKAYYGKQSSYTAKSVGVLDIGGPAQYALYASTTVTPEISELARALHNDPKLIYDYVYNNIEYVPYFGSLKGATLTLLDRCGNDFDQASLMIALLRASGYTANFIHGAKFLSYIYLSTWLEVSTAQWPSDKIVDLAVQVWGLGGVPNIRDTWTNSLGQVVPGLRIEGVWVKAIINGGNYYFDPSYKGELLLGAMHVTGYSSKAKIDIGSAIGYNRADLLAAATEGATVTGESIQNLNQEGLNNKLEGYTANLVNALRSEHPNDDVMDIVGGRQIIEKHFTSYYTAPPYPSSITTEEWTEISTAYTVTMRIQHQGIDYTFETPDITGKRLTVTYSAGSLAPELRLDGAVIASGSNTSQGSKYDLTISINHPYAGDSGTYADQTSTYKCVSGATYAIIYDFGGTSDLLINKRQKELSRQLSNGLPDISEPVMGETLNIMGLTFMKETRLVDRLVSAISMQYLLGIT